MKANHFYVIDHMNLTRFFLLFVFCSFVFFIRPFAAEEVCRNGPIQNDVFSSKYIDCFNVKIEHAPASGGFGSELRSHALDLFGLLCVLAMVAAASLAHAAFFAFVSFMQISTKLLESKFRGT